MTNTKLVSHDGRTVRVEILIASGDWNVDSAFDFGVELINIATDAKNLPALHERHVNLKASCALCVYEANGQMDRLEEDEA